MTQPVLPIDPETLLISADAAREAARAHVQAHFDWSQAAARLEAVYAGLARPGCPAAEGQPCPA